MHISKHWASRIYIMKEVSKEPMDMKYENDVINGTASVHPYSHPHFSLGLVLSLKEKEEGPKMKSSTQMTIRTALEHKDQVKHEFRMG